MPHRHHFPTGIVPSLPITTSTTTTRQQHQQQQQQQQKQPQQPQQPQQTTITSLGPCKNHYTYVRRHGPHGWAPGRLLRVSAEIRRCRRLMVANPSFSYPGARRCRRPFWKSLRVLGFSRFSGSGVDKKRVKFEDAFWRSLNRKKVPC